MTRTVTTAPTRKTLAGGGGAGLGEAFNTIFIWALEGALLKDVPTHVELAFNVIFVVGFAWVAAYFMPPAPDEGVK